MGRSGDKTTRLISTVYKIGLYASIILLLLGLLLHRLGLGGAKLAATVGTITLISTPIAGLMLLAGRSMKEGKKKTGITTLVLLGVIFLAIFLFQKIR